MKKIIYMVVLPLVLLSVLVFANREIKIETSKKSVAKPLSADESKDAKKKWEASPDGIKFKKWEASPAGIKVYAAETKIRKHIKGFTNMEGIVTALTLPPGARLGFGMMISINDEDYILSFGLEKSNEFKQLRSLKVNDHILLKSHSVSHAPKYLYPIIAGDYIAKDDKIIYKRVLGTGGC